MCKPGSCTSCTEYIWLCNRKSRTALVHVLLALLGSAVAADLDLLAGELVVVGQLLTGEDLPQGEDDDVLLTENITDFAVAVRLKTKILVGVG